MDIDLADLEAIVALAETLHFGRAADRLHVSQPALSKRVRKLEDRIGGPLLVRRYRDVRLTEAGRLLAVRGRQLLRESEATLALSQRAARGEAGRLRIGFVRLPVAGDRLVVRRVLDERLVLAIGPRSPWKARIGLRSVAAEPFIIIARSRSASFYDHALSVCAATGFAPRIVQEANELFTVLSLVGAGLGVSLVPRSAALMQLPGVRFRELTLPEAAWDIGVAWHRDAGTVPLVQRFVEMVRAARLAG